MNIRQRIEMREHEFLSPFATKSDESLGRKIQEDPCEIRTIFQRDRDRILHTKAFRRLKHKTQVFISPEGDHYRTRLTHTLEVAQISRTIARALTLNEDLTEAIALGHDLGHTPFGHTGENVLNQLHPNGFRHNEHSLRIVDELENHKGKAGLNLSEEVRDGILNHTGSDLPLTLEGQIVKIADRIAYINHDIDDSLRAGVLRNEDLPQKSISVLGESHGQRIDTLAKDIIENSWDKDRIYQSIEIAEAMQVLRKFMFQRVYLHSSAKQEEGKAINLLKELYQYYLHHPEEVPQPYHRLEYSIDDSVCYFIAGMSDRYALNRFSNIFIPRPWNG
ncbi:deoxyguanosinetriphosphate triphosphohydrolase [Gottschalkiaceae bacterium SANA]|nr:deoxyguanosinetriphosphate triphosphohydrolase [Gottschalkiaceae bacterium SANA]